MLPGNLLRTQLFLDLDTRYGSLRLVVKNGGSITHR